MWLWKGKHKKCPEYLLSQHEAESKWKETPFESLKEASQWSKWKPQGIVMECSDAPLKNISCLLMFITCQGQELEWKFKISAPIQCFWSPHPDFYKSTSHPRRDKKEILYMSKRILMDGRLDFTLSFFSTCYRIPPSLQLKFPDMVLIQELLGCPLNPHLKKILLCDLFIHRDNEGEDSTWKQGGGPFDSFFRCFL